MLEDGGLIPGKEWGHDLIALGDGILLVTLFCGPTEEFAVNSPLDVIDAVALE
jgi:hypothetical protein